MHSYSYKSYLVGFILSTILTILPFYITYYNSITNIKILTTILIICATVQIIVHLFCFLHLGNFSCQNLNILSLLFTIFIVCILIIGSIWIMEHLHHNVMLHH